MINFVATATLAIGLLAAAPNGARMGNQLRQGP